MEDETSDLCTHPEWEKGRTMPAPPREIARTRDVLRFLKCSRSTLWLLTRKDPDFPAPRIIAGQNSWFVDEIATYMETRPRRLYDALGETVEA